jgi:hypothetical protein
MATTHSVSSGVDQWKRDGRHSLRILSGGDVVWTGWKGDDHSLSHLSGGDVVWTSERGMTTTHSVSSVVVMRCGLVEEGCPPLRLLSGGEVVRTG